MAEIEVVRKLRIVSGVPEKVEAEVNDLLAEYAPQSWTYQVVGDRVVITCMMILISELRRMQIPTIATPNGGRR